MPRFPAFRNSGVGSRRSLQQAPPTAVTGVGRAPQASSFVGRTAVALRLGSGTLLRKPSHLSAIPPPRGRPGEGPSDLPFRVAYLDAERLLPVLVRKAA